MLIIKLILINLLFIVSFFLLLPKFFWLFAFNTVLVIILAVMQLHRENQNQQRTLKALLNGLLN